jgi:hypothetical protein
VAAEAFDVGDAEDVDEVPAEQAASKRRDPTKNIE